MIRIGPYCESEVPEPLEYQFLDPDGEALNLTGYTATFRIQTNGATGVSNSATVSAPLEGRVTYTWTAGDLEAGQLRAEFVATNGTNTYTSDLLKADVRPAIAVA